MAATKTRPTGASIDAYLASRASPGQLADCKAIMAMSQMQEWLAGAMSEPEELEELAVEF